jgi:hypothetical protein
LQHVPGLKYRFFRILYPDSSLEREGVQRLYQQLVTARRDKSISLGAG